MTERTSLSIEWPEHKSCLEPVPGFEIHFPHPMPNLWWRFWQWALLGWQWRNLTRNEADPPAAAETEANPENTAGGLS